MAETQEKLAGNDSTSLFGNEYFTLQGLAQHLGRTRRTLDLWHSRGYGPPRTMIGRTVLYRRESVSEWLRSLEQRRPSRRVTTIPTARKRAKQ